MDTQSRTRICRLESRTRRQDEIRDEMAAQLEELRRRVGAIEDEKRELRMRLENSEAQCRCLDEERDDMKKKLSDMQSVMEPMSTDKSCHSDAMNKLSALEERLMNLESCVKDEVHSVFIRMKSLLNKMEGETSFETRASLASPVTMKGHSFSPESSVSTKGHSFSPEPSVSMKGVSFSPESSVSMKDHRFSPESSMSMKGHSFSPESSMSMKSRCYTPEFAMSMKRRCCSTPESSSDSSLDTPSTSCKSILCPSSSCKTLLSPVKTTLVTSTPYRKKYFCSDLSLINENSSVGCRNRRSPAPRMGTVRNRLAESLDFLPSTARAPIMQLEADRSRERIGVADLFFDPADRIIETVLMPREDSLMHKVANTISLMFQSGLDDYNDNQMWSSIQWAMTKGLHQSLHRCLESVPQNHQAPWDLFDTETILDLLKDK